jgi:hypothetical protein
MNHSNPYPYRWILARKMLAACHRSASPARNQQHKQVTVTAKQNLDSPTSGSLGGTLALHGNPVRTVINGSTADNRPKRGQVWGLGSGVRCDGTISPFGNGASSAATAKITARSPDGSERLFFLKTSTGVDAPLVAEGEASPCFP